MQNSKFKKIVFLNGEFISEEKAKISALSPGFLYGWGIFETMRSYRNKIVYLDAHLKRLKDSSKLLKIEFSYAEARLKEIIKKIVEINGFSDAYVRSTLWKEARKTGILVFAREYKLSSDKKYKAGFRVFVSSLRQNSNSYLSRIKSTNRLLYELSFQEAKQKGFDEAIILNHQGYITEASRSNIFLVQDKQLFIPSLACGCLEGITRRVVLDLAKKYNIKVDEGKFTLRDLYQADEAFLTNSLMGIMPLVCLNRRIIGVNRCGEITEFLIKKYNCLLK